MDFFEAAENEEESSGSGAGLFAAISRNIWPSDGVELEAGSFLSISQLARVRVSFLIDFRLLITGKFKCRQRVSEEEEELMSSENS